MREGEGDPIGICTLASEAAAQNAVIEDNEETIDRHYLAEALVGALSLGTFTSMAAIHREMKGVPEWPAYSNSALSPKHTEELYKIFRNGVWAAGAVVTMIKRGTKTTGKYTFQIKPAEKEKKP